MDMINKFIEYCKVYTTSDEESKTSPSSNNQLVLLNKLKDELNDMGIPATIDEFGRVYAHLEGNPNYDCIGLCAHCDTAPDCCGENVNPIIRKNYDGKDIVLGNGYTMTVKDNPELKELVGKTLITTDGSTLLGADDKAGVAIIMKLASILVKQDKMSHRPLSILFTPDEEIGRGPEHFNLEKYNCKFAYTIDGGAVNEISCENFNAATAIINIEGLAIHPGDAKDKMVNACLVLNHFMNCMPADKIPSKTEGYQGFNHIVDMKGDVEKAFAAYIIRNHDRKELEIQKHEFEIAKEETLKVYPKAKIELQLIDGYRNMKEVIDQHPEVLATIEKAFKDNGSKFYYSPVRGGTDGATFSFKGCPCPNLGTGGRNFHGRYEFEIVEEMEEMLSILLCLYRVK